MQRLGKLRRMLDNLKLNTLAEYLLFNQPDGLLIASTLGKFETKPLQFMKFELGTLDSNIYQIYNEIISILNMEKTPLELSTVIYESEKNYVLVKEITDSSVLMAITKNKQKEAFISVLDVLKSESFQELKELLENPGS